VIQTPFPRDTYVGEEGVRVVVRERIDDDVIPIINLGVSNILLSI
jgi:hypothetical protein